MKIIKFISQIAILDAFYYMGTLLQMLTKAPVPGSIFGLLLLFLALKLRLLPHLWVESGARFMQKFLPLFLVPATVGAMNYFDVFTAGGQWLILIVVASTLLTIIIPGLTSQLLSKSPQRKKEVS